MTAHYWRGEYIPDIWAWARERGEEMIYYQKIRKTPWGLEVDKGYVPESMFSNLMSWGDTTYEELHREKP
jgi:hypothetical protein